MRELYVILKRDGIQPWLDEEDLLLGRNWRNQILRAIQSSDVILVCLSNSSISKNGYVKQEIELALDLADRQSDSDGRLIPVRLEECPYPERVGDFQGVDLFHPIGVQG